MSANPSQLFLLADHIKLSLLERQRAQSLALPSNTQDVSITRSLSSFLDGLEALETEVQVTPDSTLQDQVAQLRKQYNELNDQFNRTANKRSSKSVSDAVKIPNEHSLAPDFVAVQTGPKKVLRESTATPYRDDPSEEARNVLFTGAPNSEYHDEPSSDPDPQSLSNEQIHAQHSEVIAEQDEALDRLGVSIGRQRELSMRIGDELDEQVAMLEDVEDGVDRHQGRLDGARDRLGRFARKANKVDWSWYVIGILILILVLLIVVLK